MPRAAEILDLHRIMFEHVYDWAGNFRTDDVGPAGIVRVNHLQIREELHKLTADASTWVSVIKGTESLASLAQVIADFHHRFEWIHPSATRTDAPVAFLITIFSGGLLGS